VYQSRSVSGGEGLVELRQSLHLAHVAFSWCSFVGLFRFIRAILLLVGLVRGTLSSRHVSTTSSTRGCERVPLVLGFSLLLLGVWKRLSRSRHRDRNAMKKSRSCCVWEGRCSVCACSTTPTSSPRDSTNWLQIGTHGTSNVACAPREQKARRASVLHEVRAVVPLRHYVDISRCSTLPTPEASLWPQRRLNRGVVPGSCPSC
jgi:hypothetical protein